jgi:quercetin dioxygenase-like cupin family protein
MSLRHTRSRTRVLELSSSSAPVSSRPVEGHEVIRFNEAEWVAEGDGVRALVRDVDSARWAIVEYAPGSGRDEWCVVGHVGYVLAGEIEYSFEAGGTLTARAGEGFVLPAGDGHRGKNHGMAATRLLVIDQVEA